MNTVTKVFTFDAGHRLSEYDGKCKHLHGHTYRCEVTVGADDLDKMGMVVDFGWLKKIFKEFIDPKFDHKMILKRGDGINTSIAYALGRHGRPEDHICWVDYNPTAENMAQDILNIFTKWLKVEDVYVEHVRLWETSNSFADAFREIEEDNVYSKGKTVNNNCRNSQSIAMMEELLKELTGIDIEVECTDEKCSQSACNHEHFVPTGLLEIVEIIDSPTTAKEEKKQLLQILQKAIREALEEQRKKDNSKPKQHESPNKK